MEKSIKEQYEMLREEERGNTLKSFTRADALKLGMIMLEKSRSYSDPVALEITINGLAVFRHFTDGSMADSELWLKRKRNSVNLMNMSSLRFGFWLKLMNQTLEERGLNPAEYARYGGGYPINIEGTGMIGSVCISGLPNDLEDHRIIVDSLGEFGKAPSA